MDRKDVALRAPADLAGRHVDPRKRRGYFLRVLPSGVRQDHRAMQPMEQADRQLIFEQLDLMADGGGRHEQFFCCERERREPRGGFECLYRLESDAIVHGSIKVNSIHPLTILIRLSAGGRDITLESLAVAL